ncbi:MAG: hypothetical protein KGL39_54790 [Patescibacteria group bacterium]|nr:hypothetical protein [Patescibacteria group bacterium]
MPAKKTVKKVASDHGETAAKPVRLDLSLTDHQRLAALAEERGLSKASYARMAVLERMKADEARS